jgi:hypothetical protein
MLCAEDPIANVKVMPSSRKFLTYLTITALGGYCNRFQVDISIAEGQRFSIQVVVLPEPLAKLVMSNFAFRVMLCA